jgi:hypothetical protein
MNASAAALLLTWGSNTLGSRTLAPPGECRNHAIAAVGVDAFPRERRLALLVRSERQLTVIRDAASDDEQQRGILDDGVVSYKRVWCPTPQVVDPAERD